METQGDGTFFPPVPQGEIRCSQESICIYCDVYIKVWGPFMAVMAKWSACSKFALRVCLSRTALLADKPLFSNVNAL